MAEEEKKESDLKEEIIGLRERIAHQEGRKEGENWRWQRIGLIIAAAAALGAGTLFLIVRQRAETVQKDILATVETNISGTAESFQDGVINVGASREVEIRVTAQTREAEIRVTAEAREAEIRVTAEAREVEIRATAEAREAEIRATVATAYATEFSGFQTSVAKSNDEITANSDALLAAFSTAVFNAAIESIPQDELVEISTDLISARLDQLLDQRNLEQSFRDRVKAGVFATLTAIETATAAAPTSTPTAPSTP